MIKSKFKTLFETLKENRHIKNILSYRNIACLSERFSPKDFAELQNGSMMKFFNKYVILRTKSEESQTNFMRFFAGYKSPFAVNCARPAQNDELTCAPLEANYGKTRANAVSCAPLEGEPKSLISKGGQNITSNEIFHSVHNDVKDSSSYRLNGLSTLKKKAAFTLTEVLVALAIVGVIAALVLPAIISNYHKKTLDQAYDRIYNTIQSSLDGLAVSENKANFLETMMFSKTRPTSYDDNSKLFIKKYLRASKICSTNSDCFASKYYEFKNNDKVVYTPSLKGACAILKDGVSICLTPQYQKTDGTTVAIAGIVDLNGLKGPNVLGRDLRTFEMPIYTKIGRGSQTAAVLDTTFDPLVAPDESDPCADKTCGCGDLPDCPEPEPDPDPEPECSSNPNEWNETCCELNSSSVTSNTHHCCTTYTTFKNSYSVCAEDEPAVAKIYCKRSNEDKIVYCLFSVSGGGKGDSYAFQVPEVYNYFSTSLSSDSVSTYNSGETGEYGETNYDIPIYNWYYLVAYDTKDYYRWCNFSNNIDTHYVSSSGESQTCTIVQNKTKYPKLTK